MLIWVIRDVESVREIIRFGAFGAHVGHEFFGVFLNLSHLFCICYRVWGTWGTNVVKVGIDLARIYIERS